MYNYVSNGESSIRGYSVSMWKLDGVYRTVSRQLWAFIVHTCAKEEMEQVVILGFGDIVLLRDFLPVFLLYRHGCFFGEDFFPDEKSPISHDAKNSTDLREGFISRFAWMVER